MEKSVCSSNGPIKKVKTQARLGENIHMFSQKEKKKNLHVVLSYKELVSTPSKELQQLNNRKINYTIFKVHKRSEQRLHKRYIKGHEKMFNIIRHQGNTK